VTGLRIGRSARLRIGRPEGRAPLWGAAALTVLLACVAALAGAPTAAAQETALEKSLSIDSLSVVLNVQQNGDVIADETVTYSFTGEYHWLERGLRRDVGEGIADIGVLDANGVALIESGSDTPGTYRVYKEGDREWVRVNFDIADASATYTFHYRVKALVSLGKNDDALVWYVLDADNEIGIGKALVTVRLPGSVPSDQLMHEVDVGYGLAPSVYSPGPSTMVYEVTDIPAYTYVWTKTGFPKGVVKAHWTVHRVFNYIVPKLGFILPILTFLTVLLIWMRRGRDQPGQTYAKYVSEPPSDLSPGLVGALIDERVDTKEVIATIIDLARRGYLEMTDGRADGESGKSGTIFTRLKPLEELQGFEKMVAESLFDKGHPDQVTTSDLKNHFYVHVGPIVSQVYEEVTAAGLFWKNPKKTRSAWVGYGFLLGIIVGVAGFVLSKFGIDGYGWLWAGGVVSAVVVWVFAPHMPGRTLKGAREQKKWEAFRNYLKDLTRFQDMEEAQQKFETCLPYAIALGVEKEWNRRFEELTVPSPTWYHPPIIVLDGHPGPVATGGGLGGGTHLPGGGGFSLNDVSDGLFGALGKMSNVLTSAPSSSSSGRGAFGGGGFGGGGFSGGGFSGGGGGGGFRAG
jgi:uncharacterized membrane protein YgcG